MKQKLDGAVSSLNADILLFNSKGCGNKGQTVMTLEGTVGTDGSGTGNNHCLVNMKLALACVAMPNPLNARMVPVGMGAPITPMFGKVMGTSSLNASTTMTVVSDMTSADVSALIGGSLWYSVPPNLLHGSSVEIKVGLSVPVSSTAHCTSANGTYSGGTFTATAKGKW
jgi:hypothetical protein